MILTYLLLAGQPKSYLLRLNVKPAQVFRYSVRMENSATGGSYKNETRVAMKILSVKGNEIQISSAIEGMKLDGKPVTASELAKVQALKQTIVMSRRGDTVATLVNGKRVANTAIALNGAGFPEKAIKPGESWKSGVSTANGFEQSTIKFVRVENVGGKQAAYLNAFVPQPKGVAAQPTKMWVELATGMLLKMDVSADVDDAGKKGKMRFIMVRV